jgi:hypothetical protein
MLVAVNVELLPLQIVAGDAVALEITGLALTVTVMVARFAQPPTVPSSAVRV